MHHCSAHHWFVLHTGVFLLCWLPLWAVHCEAVKTGQFITSVHFLGQYG